MTNRWGAVHLLTAAVALVFGLVIGGLGPRGEARGLRDRIEELEDRKCESSGGMGREIAEVLRGRPLAGRLPENAPAEPAEAAEELPDGAPPMKEDGVRIRLGDEADDGGAQPSPEEAMKLAREAMDLRRTQARAALVEAGVNEEQLGAIDAAMGRMNDDLGALTESLVASLEGGGEPDRREMMTFAADTLDVLIESEDALFGVLTEEQRAEIDEAALDPFSYVDGDVVDELMQLQDR